LKVKSYIRLKIASLKEERIKTFENHFYLSLCSFV